jgi:hypothetical protein
METQKLISQFVDEGAARPLKHPLYQALLWMTGLILYLIVFMFFDGFRPNLMEKLQDLGFIIELLVLCLLGGSASFAAFCLSRPDSFQMSWVNYLPIPLVFIWMLTAFIGAGDEIAIRNLLHSITLGQFDCPWHILFFSSVPGIVMFVLIRMGASIRYYWAGFMATLSVTSLAYLFMRFVEDNDNPAHLIVWHALPIFLMCLVGMYAGRYALKWRLQIDTQS